MHTKLTSLRLLTFLALASFPFPGRSENFLESDDYREDDEIVGKLLADADYRIMVDEVTRNGAELDWAWALTPGWEKSHKAEAKPKSLGFSFSSYHTVYVAAPTDLVGLTRSEAEAIHESLSSALQTVGLELVDEPDDADLELTSGVVDVERVGGGFGWIQIDPFVEVEMRLTERAGHRDLLLARHQIHGYNTTVAALNLGSELARFLR